MYCGRSGASICDVCTRNVWLRPRRRSTLRTLGLLSTSSASVKRSSCLKAHSLYNLIVDQYTEVERANRLLLEKITHIMHDHKQEVINASSKKLCYLILRRAFNLAAETKPESLHEKTGAEPDITRQRGKKDARPLGIPAPTEDQEISLQCRTMGSRQRPEDTSTPSYGRISLSSLFQPHSHASSFVSTHTIK